MRSFREIIDLWGRKIDFGADIGVGSNGVNSMYIRDSIPPRYWTMAIAGAASRGIAGVTQQALTTAAARRAGGFTVTRTEDGSIIAVDPRTGLASSGGTVDEALTELRRLLAGREAA